MSLLHAIAILSALQTPADPNHLQIGHPGSVHVEPGSFADTKSGKASTFEDFMSATDHCRFVYLGETMRPPLISRWKPISFARSPSEAESNRGR